MSVTKNLTVPYHGAAGPLLDGAASIQMILESIGATVNQASLDTSIQSNNIEPGLWHADAEGVKDTLNFYKPATFGNFFVTFANPTALQGSEKITYTLHHYQVATATLVFWGGMWLVVTGVQTDVDPLAGNPYTIEAFWIYNPWTPPPGPVGEYVVYNPGWLSTYFSAISVQNPNTGQASQWNGRFVSVCDPEPPRLEQQVLRPPALENDGEQLIEPAEAMRLAQAHIQRHGLDREEAFGRALERMEPGRPELVHRLDHPANFEYLVPFGSDAKVTALLRIDARFGFLHAAASFPEGITFPHVTWDEVRQRLSEGQLETIEWMAEEVSLGQRFREAYRLFKGTWCLHPALVWLPCWESRSPFYPFYMVSVGSQHLYISCWDGTVYVRLHPFGAGGPQLPGGI